MRQALRGLCFLGLVSAVLLLATQASAQSATVTDDAFISSSSVTQAVNLGGQGLSLIVAGSGAMVGVVKVGTTTTYIKFQLPSSLPPNTTAANVAKATLKLYLSPATSPTGAINVYPVTSSWTESTLSPSSPPTLASAAFATNIAVGGANSFLVIDVTQLVQEWLEGSANGGMANDGIAIEAATSSTYVVFDSKEDIVTSHEPRLEIVLADNGPQGPAGTAATIQIGSTVTLGPNGQASVSNSGTADAAVLNFSIPEGQPGVTGPTGAAATVTVGTTTTIVAGTPAMVTNAGTANAALLNFQIPQGPIGLPGPPGPPGPMQVGAALTAAGNTFTTSQTINGNLVLNGTGTGVQFGDGTVQTTAASASAGGVPSGFSILGSGGNMPPGYSLTGILPISGTNLWSTGTQANPVAYAGIAVVPLGSASVGAGGFQVGGQGEFPVGVAPTGPPLQLFNTQTESPIVTNQVVGINEGDLSPMPTARAYLGAAVVNTTLYAVGGTADGQTMLSTVEALDFSNPGNVWQTLAPLQTARADFALASLNGNLYAIGGMTAVDASTGQITGTGTVEVYTPSSNTWSYVAPLPIAAAMARAVVVNGQIFVFSNGATQVYNASNNSWTTRTAISGVSEFAVAADSAGAWIYVIGGIIPANGGQEATASVLAYNVSADQWLTVASLPTPLWGLGAVGQTASYGITAFGGTSNGLTASPSFFQFTPPPLYTYTKN